MRALSGLPAPEYLVEKLEIALSRQFGESIADRPADDGPGAYQIPVGIVGALDDMLGPRNTTMNPGA